MTKLTVEADCGNAPRKLFLKAFYRALVNAEFDLMTENLTEQISWVLPDSTQTSGKEMFLQNVKKKIPTNADELSIDLIITHGPHAAVTGKIVLSDSKVYSFCDIYDFGTAGANKIRYIKSFLSKGSKND